MDQYLNLVFDWEGTNEGFRTLLTSCKETGKMAEFMASLLTDPRRRRIAEIQIMDSLEVFEQELKNLDQMVPRPQLGMLITDPLLIDRWTLLLRCALDFVPRKHPWVKAKILLWRIERIARRTKKLRDEVVNAHLIYPQRMACRSWPAPTPSCFPD